MRARRGSGWAAATGRLTGCSATIPTTWCSTCTATRPRRLCWRSSSGSSHTGCAIRRSRGRRRAGGLHAVRRRGRRADRRRAGVRPGDRTDARRRHGHDWVRRGYRIDARPRDRQLSLGWTQRTSFYGWLACCPGYTRSNAGSCSAWTAGNGPSCCGRWRRCRPVRRQWPPSRPNGSTASATARYGSTRDDRVAGKRYYGAVSHRLGGERFRLRMLIKVKRAEEGDNDLVNHVSQKNKCRFYAH